MPHHRPQRPAATAAGGPAGGRPRCTPLLVLTVLDSHRLLSRDEGLRMKQCEQLCARSRRITQIVLGQSRATSLAGLLLRPLSEQLQRQPRGLGIDLHLIGESADEPAAEPATELSAEPGGSIQVPCLGGVAYAPLLRAARSAFDRRWLSMPRHWPELGAGPCAGPP